MSATDYDNSLDAIAKKNLNKHSFKMHIAAYKHVEKTLTQILDNNDIPDSFVCLHIVGEDEYNSLLSLIPKYSLIKTPETYVSENSNPRDYDQPHFYLIERSSGFKIKVYYNPYNLHHSISHAVEPHQIDYVFDLIFDLVVRSSKSKRHMAALNLLFWRYSCAVEKLHTEVILSILRLSYRLREKIKYWTDFLEDSRLTLESRGEDAEALLIGLFPLDKNPGLC